jgi:hypothetical protein
LSGFGISNFQNRWTVKLRGCLGSPALQTVKIVKSFSGASPLFRWPKGKTNERGKRSFMARSAH